jgi:putative Holliday junction resolvase
LPRVLAVDPGTKKVGLALSDETGLIAQPLGDEPAEPAATLPERLAARARSLEAAALVVGLPRRMDGSQGPEAMAARELAQRLREASGLPVELVDERLTSAAAERALLEAGQKRAQRKRLAHRVSAALILQSYLDRTRSERRA